MLLSNKASSLVNEWSIKPTKTQSTMDSTISTSRTWPCKNTSKRFETSKAKTSETEFWRRAGSKNTSKSGTVRTWSTDCSTSWSFRNERGSTRTSSAATTWSDCRTLTSSSCDSDSTTTTSTKRYQWLMDYLWWGNLAAFTF